MFDSTSFTVTVEPVNDAPVLDALSDATTSEDTAYSVSLSSSDVDGDALTYFAQVDANATVLLDDSILTVMPDQDFYGDILVSVTVNDGLLSDSDSFTLSVTPVNDAPVISTIANQAIDEDTSLTLTLSASDVDGDTLTYSASNGNADISVDGSTLTVTPEADFNGEIVVDVTVTDGDLFDSTSFSIIVNPCLLYTSDAADE